MVVVLLSIFVCSHGAAEADVHELAGKSWAAFQCSVLAEKQKNEEEQERLFRLGYEAGLTFIKAADQGELDSWQVANQAPIGFTMRMGGPTADFVLGRVFEAASVDILSKLHRECEECIREKELLKLFARSWFRERNCGLVR